MNKDGIKTLSIMGRQFSITGTEEPLFYYLTDFSNILLGYLIMNQPKVSIAMCTYNGAKYVLEQLESFAHQTCLPDEVVICDDVSQDNTFDLVRQYAQQASFPIRLYSNEKNLGYGQNFSKAIELTTGDIIFMSDQDDVWHPTKIQKFIDEFQRHQNVIMVMSDTNLVNEKLVPLGKTFFESMKFKESDKELITSSQSFALIPKYYINAFAGAAMAFRGAAKNILLPIPENWSHDGWIAMVTAATGRISLIDEPLNDYRQHPKQTSGSKNQSKVESFQQAQQRSMSIEYFTNILEEYQLLRTYLAKREGMDLKPGVLDILDRKITHTQSQLRMRQQPRLLRIPLVFQELFTGRYNDFSRVWWRGFVKDLLL
jgi:glycosyltransferase involved in cell wall biosynthesis